MVKKELEKATKNYENDGSYVFSIEDIMLEDIIEKVLKESVYVLKYNICSSEMFDSPGYCCGYVVASWLEIGEELHTEVYEWEMN